MTTATAFKRLRAAVRTLPPGARIELERLIEAAINAEGAAGECVGAGCQDEDCTRADEAIALYRKLHLRLGLPWPATPRSANAEGEPSDA